EVVNLSGSIESGAYDYYINGSKFAQGNIISEGEYSWLFVDPHTIADVDLWIDGTRPIYDITNSYGFLSDYFVTGEIVNLTPSRVFKIFDVETIHPNFTVVDFYSGDVTGSAPFTLSG